MIQKEYTQSVTLIGQQVLNHVYEKYSLRDESVRPEKWKSIIKEVKDKYPSVLPEVLIGGLIASLKDLENPASYPDPDTHERDGMRKVIKDAFFTRYYTINKLFNEWKGLQKVFFTYANELSFRLLGEALFDGFLSHATSLFEESVLLDWLIKEGKKDANVDYLPHLYENLPGTSKSHLLSLLRERRRKYLEKEEMDPMMILIRRWNMVSIIEQTDGLYYYDLLKDVIEKDKDSLKKETLIESLLDWSTKQFLEIEKGIHVDSLSLTPEPEEEKENLS